MTAGEYCTRAVVVTRKDATVIDAARLMRDYHVGNLVVVEERDGQRYPIGILTDRDIVVGIIAREADYLTSLVVGDVMSLDPATARENESLTVVLERMCAHGIRRIPVVNDKGGLEGILSTDDLIDHVREELAAIAKLMACQRKREEEKRG